MRARWSAVPTTLVTAALLISSVSVAKEGDTLPRSTQQLLQLMTRHASPEIRRTSAFRLSKSGQQHTQVIRALQFVAMKDPDARVRQAARQSLNKLAADGNVSLGQQWTPNPTPTGNEPLPVWSVEAPRGMTPEPLMDLSFHPAPEVPEYVTLEPDAVEEVVVETSSGSVEEVAVVDPAPVVPISTESNSEQVEQVRSVQQPAESKAIAATNPVETMVETVVQQEEPIAVDQADTAGDAFSLYRIPRSVEGRQAMAKNLMDQARVLLDQGKLTEAEEIAYHLQELAIDHKSFGDNPAKLLNDIARARSLADLLYQGIKEL